MDIHNYIKPIPLRQPIAVKGTHHKGLQRLSNDTSQSPPACLVLTYRGPDAFERYNCTVHISEVIPDIFRDWEHKHWIRENQKRRREK